MCGRCTLPALAAVLAALRYMISRPPREYLHLPHNSVPGVGHFPSRVVVVVTGCIHAWSLDTGIARQPPATCRTPHSAEPPIQTHVHTSQTPIPYISIRHHEIHYCTTTSAGPTTRRATSHPLT